MTLETMASTVRCIVSLYMFIVTFVIMSECPRGTRAGNYGPLVAPYTILTPQERIVFIKDEVNVILSMDMQVYISHVAGLADVHQNITQKLKEFNITVLPLNSLSAHARILIENIAANLINALQVLPQEEECRAKRKKRDVEILAQGGIFPGLGRALAYMTGTLTSDAAKYINLNYNNILKIRESQGKLIRVVNETSQRAYKNSVQLRKVSIRVDNLSEEFSSKFRQEDLLDALEVTLQDLILAITATSKMVEEVVQITQSAVMGKLHSSALKNKELWSSITSVLDAETTSQKNLKYFVKESAAVDISVCGPVIHVGIRVPLIEKKKLLGYRVHPIPVYRNAHYEAVKSYPYLLTWSNTEVLEFEADEVAECTKLRNYLLCKRPRKVEKLSKNCFYSLVKQLTVRCEFVVKKALNST